MSDMQRQNMEYDRQYSQQQMMAASAMQANVYPQSPPQQPSLELIGRAIGELRDLVSEMHSIADRAFGSMPPQPEKPAVVPNGMLDQVEHGLAEVIHRARATVERFRRLA